MSFSSWLTRARGGLTHARAKCLDWLQRPRDLLHQKLTKTWLIGTLFSCKPKNFLGAFYEFLHGLIFATMPFWLGGLVLLVLAQPPTPDELAQSNVYQVWISKYWVGAVETFSRGELLVFSISLLSPTLWLTTYEPEGARVLPHRRPVSTLAVVVIIVGAVLFALLKQGDTVNGNAVFWISVVLTAAAFVLRYLVLVYHGYRLPDISELQLTRPTDDWMKTVENHRKATS